MRRIFVLVMFALFLIGCGTQTVTVSQQLDDLSAQLTDMQVQIDELSEEKTNLAVEKAVLESQLTDAIETLKEEREDRVGDERKRTELNGRGVSCSSDADCGYLEWVSDKHCSQGQSYKTFLEYGCVNPDTEHSDCVLINEEKMLIECKKDEFCRGGECLNIENFGCTDTDGGLNYSVKGYVEIYSGKRYTDRCDGNTLIERYCPNTDFIKSTEPLYKKQLEAGGVVYEGFEGLVASKRKPCFDNCKDGVCRDLCDVGGEVVPCETLK